MFSFGKRKKQLEVQQFVRRVIDTSSPNLPRMDGDSRWETRSNRTIPVLIAPLEDDGPVVDDAAYALTKNLSSQGAALVLLQPFRAQPVIIGFQLESLRGFLIGDVRQIVSIGGGYWQLGVEFTEVTQADEDHAFAPLLPKLEALRPQESAELQPQPLTV